ncbi:MAG: 6-bladed beta-propeller [Magnetococcus sp. DMHC-6]
MRTRPHFEKWHIQKLFSLALMVLLAGCVSTPEPAQELKPLVYPSPPDPARFVYERTIRSNADVEPAKEEDSFDMAGMLTGEEGMNAEGLNKPFGIVVVNGKIYVSDTVKRAILLFDPANGRFKEIGKEDPGILSKPLGMAADAAGNIYVMDASKKRVMSYDAEGNFLRSIGTAEQFDRPSAVAVNPEGTKLFAVDTGSARGKDEFHRIRVFNPKTGEHLFDMGSRGSGEGQFNLLKAAAVGPDGLLYVVDSGNFRIQIFDQTGKFIRKFGEVGRQLGQFARPKGVALDKDGNIYVSDASHGNFQIFNNQGELLLFVGDRGKESDRASYMLPAMITLDADGRVYMVDQGYRKVDVFRPANLKESEGALGVAFEKLKLIKPKEK